MKRIDINAIKANIVFAQDKLPAIDPGDPEFTLNLGGTEIRGRCNPKAVRKLAQHRGGCVLQGRLVVEGGRLVLLDAGFTLLDPKPAAPPPILLAEGSPPAGAEPPVG
jgi:hypothetical protein